MLFFYLIFDFYTNFTFFETFQIKYSPSPGMKIYLKSPLIQEKLSEKRIFF